MVAEAPSRRIWSELLEVSSNEDGSGQEAVAWAQAQVEEWENQGREDQAGDVDKVPWREVTPPPNQLANEGWRTESPEIAKKRRSR